VDYRDVHLARATGSVRVIRPSWPPACEGSDEVDGRVPVSTAAALFALNSVNAASTAQTAPSVAPAVESCVELLEPVANASQILLADDPDRAQQKPPLQLVRWHHHHHHHDFFRGFGFGLGFGAPG
jgi:hypothetical protein